MNLFLIIILLVLALQVVLFFYIRSKNRSSSTGIIKKYGISTAREAWDLINDPAVPEEEKKQLEVFYRSMLNN